MAAASLATVAHTTEILHQDLALKKFQSHWPAQVMPTKFTAELLYKDSHHLPHKIVAIVKTVLFNAAVPNSTTVQPYF